MKKITFLKHIPIILLLLVTGGISAQNIRSEHAAELTKESPVRPEPVVHISTFGGRIQIETTQTGVAEVYNLVGQKIRTQRINEGLNEINDLTAGNVYIVKFAGKTQKIVL